MSPEEEEKLKAAKEEKNAKKKDKGDKTKEKGKGGKKDAKGKGKSKGKGDGEEKSATVEVGPTEVVQKFDTFYEDYENVWAKRDETGNQG